MQPGQELDQVPPFLRSAVCLKPGGGGLVASSGWRRGAVPHSVLLEGLFGEEGLVADFTAEPLLFGWRVGGAERRRRLRRSSVLLPVGVGQQVQFQPNFRREGPEADGAFEFLLVGLNVFVQHRLGREGFVARQTFVRSLPFVPIHVTPEATEGEEGLAADGAVVGLLVGLKVTPELVCGLGALPTHATEHASFIHMSPRVFDQHVLRPP